MSKPKFPHVKVNLGDLDGPEGNAFAILGKVNRAMRKANVPFEDQDKFAAKAIDGSYKHLLQTVEEYVTVI
jgi:hypothetical protein